VNRWAIVAGIGWIIAGLVTLLGREWVDGAQSIAIGLLFLNTAVLVQVVNLIAPRIGIGSRE